MIHTGTIGYLCYIRFDFEDATFKEYDEIVLNQGMGLESDDIVRYTMNVLLEVITLNEVLDTLDKVLFPEHVPNESVETCMSVCVQFMIHLARSLKQYKKDLNILVSTPIDVYLNRRTSTLELTFSL